MARVRIFKDRADIGSPSSHGADGEHTELSHEAQTLEERANLASPNQDIPKEIVSESVSPETSPAVQSIGSNAPSQQYAIKVPGLEGIMARVNTRAETHQASPQTNMRLSHSLEQRPPYHSLHQRQCLCSILDDQAPCNANVDPKTRPTPAILNTNTPFRDCDLTRTSMIELAGYAGLEDLPILDRIMKHPDVDHIHRFLFQYNDVNCPAAVLLVDPLVGPKGVAELNRNRWNDGHEAWLYTRKQGDIRWSRDRMAERGGMRQAVYLSRCEKGWKWEQQLGDLLDCRKSLNLWIKVKG